jgi:CHASE3 domain sensor protein
VRKEGIVGVPPVNFQVKALALYMVLALVLAGGMAMSVTQLSSTVDAQLARLRGEEREITMVERLRWHSESIVSDGRGYLLSGDPALLVELEDSTARFDAKVRALGASANPFVAEVETSEAFKQTS